MAGSPRPSGRPYHLQKPELSEQACVAGCVVQTLSEQCNLQMSQEVISQNVLRRQSFVRIDVRMQQHQ